MKAFQVDQFVEGLHTNDSGKKFWVLLDPDREEPEQLKYAAEVSVDEGADTLLVGSSYYERNDFDESVKAVQEGAGGKVPVLLFPGNHQQLSEFADALLFLSLLSGRNPQYLIGEHILAAPKLRRMDLPAIPTGYYLVDGGRVTSVQSVTGTTPLPRKKIELIASHALAGQYLGMKLVYLEAGSGAKLTVPLDAIALTQKTIDVPLIVGGGIRTPEAAHAAAKAGADIVVIGNHLEKSRDPGRVREMAVAVHSAAREPVAKLV